MRRRKESRARRAAAILLSATLIAGTLSDAVPMTVLAQEAADASADTETQKSDCGDVTVPVGQETGTESGDESGTKPVEELVEVPEIKPGETPEIEPGDMPEIKPTNPEEGSGGLKPGEEPPATGGQDGVTEPAPDDEAGQETPEPGTEEETEPGTVSGNDAETEPVAAPQIMMMTAAPQADNIASGEGWTLDADGRLTITSDTGMAGWIASRYTTHNGTPYNLLVTSAEITGVTGIGKDAFLACSNLTGSITLPEGVTSIGENAFNNCPKLTGITILGNVTDIGKTAFAGCGGLTGITIPGSVTSIGDYAFATCEGLTSITIPDTVTSIGGGIFSGCSSLTSVTLPNNMTGISSRMFRNCSSLTSITIPQNVTAIGESAFSGCEGLQEITVPGTVTQIDRFAFAGCASLESITFLSDTPPTLGMDVFGYDDSSNPQAGGADARCGFVKGNRQGIHVPDGNAEAYKTATDKGWDKWAAYIADNATPAEKHEHDGVTFTAWTETGKLPPAEGNYYLTQDVTLAGGGVMERGRYEKSLPEREDD